MGCVGCSTSQTDKLGNHIQRPYIFITQSHRVHRSVSSEWSYTSYKASISCIRWTRKTFEHLVRPPTPPTEVPTQTSNCPQVTNTFGTAMTLSVSILMPSMPSPNYVQTSKVKVRHLYTALNANELSISPGHILEILEKEEGGMSCTGSGFACWNDRLESLFSFCTSLYVRRRTSR